MLVAYYSTFMLLIVLTLMHKWRRKYWNGALDREGMDEFNDAILLKQYTRFKRGDLGAEPVNRWRNR